MGIRSTNVYEERSLGIYRNEKAEPPVFGSKAASVGRYLSWHMRRQLAFGSLFNRLYRAIQAHLNLRLMVVGDGTLPPMRH